MGNKIDGIDEIKLLKESKRLEFLLTAREESGIALRCCEV